jgi:UrcA family protein
MKIIFSIAAAMIAFASAPLPAQTVTNTQVVRHADLDLSRAAHVARLDRRLNRAAREVCGSASSIDVAGQNANRRCVMTLRRSLAPQRNRLVAAARPVDFATAR